MSDIPVLAEENGLKLVAEHKHGAVFAYLWSNTGIVGDVWLFNTAGTPENEPWKNGTKPPCANAARYVDIAEHERRNPQLDLLRAQYRQSDDDFMISDAFGTLATLKRGDKPGQNALVLIDGPLAKRLGAVQ